jgi:hypothetical protein
MKRIFVFLTVILLAVTVSFCGDDTEPDPNATLEITGVYESDSSVVTFGRKVGDTYSVSSLPGAEYEWGWTATIEKINNIEKYIIIKYSDGTYSGKYTMVIWENETATSIDYSEGCKWNADTEQCDHPDSIADAELMLDQRASYFAFGTSTITKQ